MNDRSRFHRYRLVMLLGLALLGGCDDVSNHHARMHGPTLTAGEDDASLSPGSESGQRLAARYCSQCHDQPSPRLHTRAEWPAVFARMLDNMQRQQRAFPDRNARHQILDYLQRNARDE